MTAFFILGFYPHFTIIYIFYHIEKCRKYSTGVVLGRKFSYFTPAGGSGKKNSQTQISKKIHKLKSLCEKFDIFSKLCYTVNRKARIAFLFTKLPNRARSKKMPKKNRLNFDFTLETQ